MQRKWVKHKKSILIKFKNKIEKNIHTKTNKNIKENNTKEKKDKIIEHIMKYVKKHDCIDGEHLMQDDECLIYAPDVLCDILDVFDFKTEWVD